MPRGLLDPTIAERIGKNIETLRIAGNFGTGEFARASGISSPTITQIEAGKRVPSVAFLVKLRRTLQCSWNDIFRGVGDA